MSSERVVPYCCPYCGEEDIRPYGERHGEWRCGGCLRAWRLAYLGLTGRDAAPRDPEESGSDAAPGDPEESGSPG